MFAEDLSYIAKWDQEIVKYSSLEAIEYIKNKNINNLELMLLIPSIQKNNQFEVYSAFNYAKIFDNKSTISQNVILDINYFLQSLMKDSILMPSMYIDKIVLYENDWNNSITNAFDKMNYNIKSKEFLDIHVIYLLHHTLFENIPYILNIPNENYIVY